MSQTTATTTTTDQDLTVEASRAKRLERQQSRFRDRGGIFVPSTHNALLDVLLARGVNGESPTKGRQKTVPEQQGKALPAASTSKARRKCQAAKVAEEKDRASPVSSASKARRKSHAPPVEDGEDEDHADAEAARGAAKNKTNAIVKNKAPAKPRAKAQPKTTRTPAKRRAKDDDVDDVDEAHGEGSSRTVAAPKPPPKKWTKKIVKEAEDAGGASNYEAQSPPASPAKPSTTKASRTAVLANADDTAGLPPDKRTTKRFSVPGGDDADASDYEPAKRPRAKATQKPRAPRKKKITPVPELDEEEEEEAAPKAHTAKARTAKSQGGRAANGETAAAAAEEYHIMEDTRAAKPRTAKQKNMKATVETLQRVRDVPEGSKHARKPPAKRKGAKSTVKMVEPIEEATIESDELAVKPHTAKRKPVTVIEEEAPDDPEVHENKPSDEPSRAHGKGSTKSIKKPSRPIVHSDEKIARVSLPPMLPEPKPAKSSSSSWPDARKAAPQPSDAARTPDSNTPTTRLKKLKSQAGAIKKTSRRVVNSDDEEPATLPKPKPVKSSSPSATRKPTPNSSGSSSTNAHDTIAHRPTVSSSKKLVSRPLAAAEPSSDDIPLAALQKRRKPPAQESDDDVPLIARPKRAKFAEESDDDVTLLAAKRSKVSAVKRQKSIAPEGTHSLRFAANTEAHAQKVDVPEAGSSDSSSRGQVADNSTGKPTVDSTRGDDDTVLKKRSRDDWNVSEKPEEEPEQPIRPAKRANVSKSAADAKPVRVSPSKKPSKKKAVEAKPKPQRYDKENVSGPLPKAHEGSAHRLKPKPKPRLSLFPSPAPFADSDDDPIDFLS